MDGHGDLLHGLFHTRCAQGGPATVRNDEVYAATCVDIGLARIPAALIHLHRVATLGQENGEQTADQSSAYDGDLAHAWELMCYRVRQGVDACAMLNCGSSALSGHCLIQGPAEAPHILEAIVHRHRRHPQDIGFTPIAENPFFG